MAIRACLMGALLPPKAKPVCRPRRLLGKPVDCDKFQDGRAFLENNGQKGPQAAFLTPGSYRINTFLFEIVMVPITRIQENKVGIVTTLDGEPLNKGEIAGGSVEGHRNYQDPMAFIKAGGKKGLQEDVILAGTYYLNPWFAIVEQVDMIHIHIGYVGVVNSFVGPDGIDTSGVGFIPTATSWPKTRKVFGTNRLTLVNTPSTSTPML